MDLINKTKDELIQELQKLRKEHDSLRELFKDEIYDRKKIGSILDESNSNLDCFPGIAEEGRYRRLIENIDEVIFELDENGVIIYISPAIYCLLGFESEELRNKNFLQWINENIELHLSKRLDLSVLSESKTDCAILSKTNELRWIQFSWKVLVKDGIGGGIIGTLSDITDKKLKELELQKNELLYKSFLYSSPDIITITNLEGLIIFTSVRALKMFGFEQSDALFNRSIFEYVDKKDHERAREAIAEMFKGNIFGAAEYTGVKSDGSTFDIEVNAEFIRDSLNQPIHMIFVTREITDRKRVENEVRDKTTLLSNLISNLQEGILLENSSRRILLTNQLFCDMFQIPVSPEWMIGEDCSDSAEQSKGFFKDPEKFTVCIAKILAEKKAVFDDALELLDGRHYERDYIPTYLNNEYSGHLWKYRDVTERKQAEQILKSRLRLNEYSYAHSQIELQQKLLDELELLTNSSIGLFHSIASNQNSLIFQSWSTGSLLQNDYSNGQDKYRDIGTSSIWADCVAQRKAIVYNDYNNLPECRRLSIDCSSVKRELLVPIFRENLVVAVVELFNKPIDYNERDIEVVSLLADLAWDISERKGAEEGMKKLSQAIDQSPSLIYITDLAGSIEYVNPKVLALTGYTKDELIGQSPRIFSTHEKSDIDYQLLWQTISSGKEWKGEFHNKKKNGDFYWVLVSISPVFITGDSISHYLAIQEDITDRKLADLEIYDLNMNLERKIEERTAQLAETNANLWKEIEVRKRVEEALSVSENSYRTVIENVTEIIFRTDMDGLWLFLNKSWEEITGFSVEESIGKSFVNYVHPADRLRNMELFKPLINREKAYCRHQIRYLTKSGGFRWIEVFARLGLNEHNEITGTFGTLQDITERKLAEEALRVKTSELENFFNVALDLLCISDTSGNFLKVNKAWENILGYSVHELESKNFLEFIHPEDIQSTLDVLAQLSGQHPIFNFINRYKTKDGNYRFIEWRSYPVDNLVYTAARDITERKLAQNFENELLQLSPKLTGIPLSEMDSALNLALSRIGQFLGADRSYIFEFNPDGLTMNNTHEWCNEEVLPEIGNLQGVACEMLPMWMKRLRRHESIIISSVEDLPDSWLVEREILESKGVKSLIVIPILTENNLIGFVGLDATVDKREYNSAEINILKVWSSMLASLINNQRIESLLEQTRQNYETFFNTIDDFLFVLDEKGNIIHTNNTVENRLEFSMEELINQSVLAVHPVERREEANRIVGEMLAGITEYCPVPLVTKSGKLFPVETRVKRGFWNGQPVIFGVSKDISQIKLSEQKFATAFQSNSAMMAISLLENGKLLDVNHSFLETLGYSREEIIGKTNHELDFFVDPNLRKEIDEKLNQHIPVRKLEILMRTKNGIIKTGLLSCDSIFIGDDHCLLTVTLDITERKQVEDEIRKARLEAEQANLAKSEFLSRMSHELRTPMNSILGFAQLFLMGDLNLVQKKGVNHILRSGKHLLDLINEVLDISRIEAGHLSLSLEPVQLSGIILEMMDTVRPLAVNGNISLELIDSPVNKLFVKSDRQRLKQVLLNLLNNAVKYNKNDGKVCIKAEILQTDNFEKRMIRISVSDTGMGISSTDIPKLFKPFERIGAEKTETEGTGLGLAVVKKLMDAMDGCLGVRSEPGEGSTFWIEVPHCESPLESVEKAGSLTGSVAKFADNIGIILYIEDNTSNIELVEQIISSQRPGIQIITSSHGCETVQLALEYKPDLILLDLNLPDIHGSEVIKFIMAEEATKSIPVVVVSADAMPQQLEKLMKAGAKNYLTKPLDVVEFLKVIDTFIVG